MGKFLDTFTDYFSPSVKEWTDYLGLTEKVEPSLWSYWSYYSYYSYYYFSYIKSLPFNIMYFLAGLLGLTLMIKCVARLRKSAILSYFTKSTSQKRVNKMEEECRRIVEKLFNRKFPSIRPNWLNNPKTGRNLELDMYNEDLRLAFEYNGVQHVKYTPRFHNSEEDFRSQVERDKLKHSICRKNGITLIDIPHTISQKNLSSYIRNACLDRGIRLI